MSFSLYLHSRSSSHSHDFFSSFPALTYFRIHSPLPADTLVTLRVGVQWHAGFSVDDDARLQEFSCLSAFHCLETLTITQSHPQLCSILSLTPCPLRELYINLTEYDTGDLSLRGISGLTSIHELTVVAGPGVDYVSPHRLSDLDAASIASLPHLERLNVVCPISRQGMQSLCSCTALKSLTLKSYGVVVPGGWLSRIHRPPCLSHLVLPPLTHINEALTHLARMPCLSRLFLCNDLNQTQRDMLSKYIVIQTR